MPPVVLRCFQARTFLRSSSDKTVVMTGKLVDTAQTLRSSIEKISSNPTEAINEAKKVGEIEHAIDVEYLKCKSLFVKYGVEHKLSEPW